MLMGDLTHYSMEDLKEISDSIRQEIQRRKFQAQDACFAAMVKAIRDFEEVCPSAYVQAKYTDDCLSIEDLLDRDCWSFGE